jgi:predicted DCC family thiol-disulfide oxidoreductase YuxK
VLNTHGGQAEPPQAIVVYDGACERCRRWVAWARSLDARGRIRTLPLQDSRATRVTGRSRQALLRAVHLVHPDGSVVDGPGAVRDVLRYLRGGGLFAWIFRLPGAPWVAARAYAWVARRRKTGAAPTHATGDPEMDSRCAGVP